MPSPREEKQPFISQDTGNSWGTYLKKNKGWISVTWIVKAFSYSYTNLVFASGGNKACNQGIQDGLNSTDYSNHIDFFQAAGGAVSMHLMPPVVLIASLLAYDGGKLIASDSWTDTFKGFGYLGASLIMIGGASFFESLIAEPLLQQCHSDAAYDTGYNYKGHGEYTCDKFEFPAGVFTGLNVVAGGVAAGSALLAARYGHFKGKKELEEKHVLTIVNIQSNQDDNPSSLNNSL